MESDNKSIDDNLNLPVRPGRFWRIVSRVLLGVVLAGMVFWGTLAIYWSNLPEGWRTVVAGLFGVGSVLFLLFTRLRWRGLLVFLSAFALLVIWWLRIPPSNTRHWQSDLAVLTSATITGNKMTLHNIRNCEYRSETDFDVRYYDRTFDLDKLRTADLYVVYWGSPYIAHTMVSFGFEGDQYVCISIETRKEQGEDYSAVKGFFKQYELAYIVSDERDVVRLRTNFRNGEDVYLYRLRTTPDVIRKVFLDYLKAINRLNQHPEWYNALTTNCTTSIRGHAIPYAKRPWPSWKLILNGHVDEMAYGNGALDQSLPFAELKARSLINERARAADKDPAFSKRIREGLPGMGQ
jgi:hypothetical protein